MCVYTRVHLASLSRIRRAESNKLLLLLWYCYYCYYRTITVVIVIIIITIIITITVIVIVIIISSIMNIIIIIIGDLPTCDICQKHVTCDEYRYSIEQTNVALFFSGGTLNGIELLAPSLVICVCVVHVYCYIYIYIYTYICV